MIEESKKYNKTISKLQSNYVFMIPRKFGYTQS